MIPVTFGVLQIRRTRDVLVVLVHFRFWSSGETYESLLSNDLTKKNRQSNFDILDLLIASDELLLSELFDHIQDYLLNTKFEWVKRNVVKVHRTIYPHEGCKRLQNFCLDAICKNPVLVFESKDFLEFEESLLTTLLSRNDLQIEEIVIWEHLIRWGMAQMSGLNSSSSSTSSSFVSISSMPFCDDTNSLVIDNSGANTNNVDLSAWNNEDFLELERILHNCIPLIRFFHISSNDFYDKIWPFQKILPDDLKEDVLQYYLKRNTIHLNLSYYAITHAESHSLSSNTLTSIPSPLKNISRYLQPPRIVPFNSTLIKTEHVARFGGNSSNNNNDSKSGNSSGCSSGYSSGSENSASGNGDKNSVQQSNEKRLNLDDAKLSRVRRPGYAIRIKDKTYGPCFGDKDLWMRNNFNAYDSCSSDKDDYSDKVTTLSKFWVMEYEVFQVIRK
ncbi:6502_t:CDS:2, partial [Acaulospora morrowiae]